MRTLTLMLATLLALVAVPATLADQAPTHYLGSQAPDKPIDHSVYIPPAEPPRQGGNTIEEAIPITIPGTYTGTTVGYTNEYDEICPYSGSTAPDVVYSVTPTENINVDIDLCYSSFDTKLYVYDENLNLVACNDDAHFGPPCFVFSSKLEDVLLQTGMTYYIVIDGYGSAAGAYQMDIDLFEPCILDLSDCWVFENEPPLVDGYQDAHNGGCNSPEFGNPFQRLTPSSIFCGVSGWYISPNGSQSRDTDWFLVAMPNGFAEIYWADAEYPTYLFWLAPTDCAAVQVVESAIVGACQGSYYPIWAYGQPGEDAWFWVGPTTFTGPVNEYNYVLIIGPVGLPTVHWTYSDVKSLFN